jgi:protein tyrosine phosphatase
MISIQAATNCSQSGASTAPLHPLDKFSCKLTDIRGNLQSAMDQVQAVEALLATPEFVEETRQTIGAKYPKTKNRDDGILPHDRTLLTGENPYVNANLLSAPSFTNFSYIVAQAPLQESIADLFNAMLQKNSRTIVANVMHMETRVRDNYTREKCANYWEQRVPLGGGLELGPAIEVSRVMDGDQGIIVRKLPIFHQDGKLVHEVTLMHYQNWPDHGAPRPEMFKVFQNMVTERLAKDRQEGFGAAVFHCSAGMGRSGIAVTIQAIRDYIDQERAKGKRPHEIDINIAKLFFELRLCRRLLNNLTKAEPNYEQYNFILSWVESYVKTL